jgi:hypothetical protein
MALRKSSQASADAVEIAVEAGVLTHGIASRLDDGSQLCLV